MEKKIKVKVMFRFKDKNTRKMHEQGEEYSVTAERYEEIKNFVKPVEKETETSNEQEQTQKK